MPPPARVAVNAMLLDSAGGFRSAGIHRYLLGLLAALPATGTDVVAFTADPTATAALPGVDVRPVGSWARVRPLRILWEQTVLPLAARRAGAAVIHGGAYAVPRISGLPRVVTVHDLSFFRVPDTLPAMQAAYLRAATRQAVRSADAIIAVSRFTARELEDVLAVEPSRIHVVPNGIDANAPVPTASQVSTLRDRLKLPVGYLLAVGTLQPRKNIATLLAAYAKLVASLPDAPDLVVAGSPGWGNVSVRGAAQSLGIGRRVHTPGFVPDADLAALYAGARLFAMPSLYEGFGLPALEAMAAGVPVVVSQASSFPEIVGDAGLTVPPLEVDAWAAALRRLVEEPDLARRLGDSGRERAATFTWQRAAEATAQVYRGVAGTATRPTLEVDHGRV